MGDRSAADLNALDRLRGRWTIRRSIEDAGSGVRGAFAGVAEFTADGEGLAWVESGVLRWPTYRGPAGRTLRVAAGEGAVCTVYFPDGRFFHELDFGAARSHVSHDCAPDRYAGVVDVIDMDSWRVEWVCDGPLKKLVIRTAYRRLGVLVPAPPA